MPQVCYTFSMRQKKFPYPLLVLSILFLGITLYSIFHFPPSYSFGLFTFTLPLFPFVLLSFILFLFCTISFVSRSLIHGILLSVCTLLYLLLRLAGLTSLFFLVLILALCITLELFFFKKN